MIHAICLLCRIVSRQTQRRFAGVMWLNQMLAGHIRYMRRTVLRQGATVVGHGQWVGSAISTYARGPSDPQHGVSLPQGPYASAILSFLLLRPQLQSETATCTIIITIIFPKVQSPTTPHGLLLQIIELAMQTAGLTPQ